MSSAVIWSKSKPDVEFQYGGRLGEFDGMSSHSHLPHCRVLPPGEFNVMIPELRVILQGVASLPPGEFNGMSSQSHVSHCRVLPLGEFTVMIPEPHVTLQGAVRHLAKSMLWSCHIAECKNSICQLKIVFRHILFIFVFNAIWALTRGGFRIVSDTLVWRWIIVTLICVIDHWRSSKLVLFESLGVVSLFGIYRSVCLSPKCKKRNVLKN